MSQTLPNHDPLPRLIYLTSLRLQIHADRVLQPLGITLEQMRPLKILHRANGVMSQRQLCDMAEKTPANMTRILDRLTAKNLVERLPDPTDRRAFQVALTPAGKKLVKQIGNRFGAFLEQVLTGLSEEEIESCRQTLERVRENLNGLGPDE